MLINRKRIARTAPITANRQRNEDALLQGPPMCLCQNHLKQQNSLLEMDQKITTVI